MFQELICNSYLIDYLIRCIGSANLDFGALAVHHVELKTKLNLNLETILNIN